MQPVLVQDMIHTRSAPITDQNRHPQPSIKPSAKGPSSLVPRGTDLDSYSEQSWLNRSKSPKSLPSKYMVQKFGV